MRFLRITGLQVSVDQACDILRTWQANHSWLAMAIQDNLALVNFGGFLRAVGPDRLQLSDGEEKTVHLVLIIPRKANYEYRVNPRVVLDQPYETLRIHWGECLAKLGAFREQPKEPAWLML